MNVKTESLDIFKESLLAHAEGRGLSIDTEGICTILSIFLSPAEPSLIQASQLPTVIKMIEQLPTESSTVLVLRAVETGLKKHLGENISGRITLSTDQQEVKNLIEIAKAIVGILRSRMIESYATVTQ